MPASPPLILVNAVGLTTRLLEYAPRLSSRARSGWLRTLIEAVPAVTCTAQATILTGQPPRGHGIVANGWLYRETMEVRFWQQSNRLLEAQPVYVSAGNAARAQGRGFRAAKLFWWFNQGAAVDFSLTPKPHYGADGNKVFGITGRPPGLAEEMERRLGPFPFQTFWGPLAGRPCTEWIAQAAAAVVRRFRPDLTLVYLPHLDYDPQRFGPARADMKKLVAELDAAFAIIEEAAQPEGARLWIVSEYSHVAVRRPVYLNRLLRRAGLLAVRPGPFGEMLETFESRAFAVCDHQAAHVYIADPQDVPVVCDLLAAAPGVASILSGDQRAALGLDHSRSGELIVLAEPDAWFAYPYWLDDRRAPDFARTVDIHRKPGFDPCELFFDPKLWWARGRALARLVQKKLGFRSRFDVIPLDAELVGGSHGLRAADPLDRPVLIGDGPAPDPPGALPMTAIHDLLLASL